jgi:poly(3-hydroxybutyrate) depolymerase
MSITCTVIATVAILIIVSSADARAPRTDVTVSGASSGAAMANQLHFAFSKDISGCGVLAGPPYYCAGSLLTAAACISGSITSVSVPFIESKLKSFAKVGTVDDLSNIKGDPVYIFSGKYDTIVLPGVAKLNEKLYSLFGANILTNYDLPATHSFPTDNFGTDCATPNLQSFINNW